LAGLKLMETANRGLPIQATVIDTHAHMGPYWNFHIPFNDAEGMIGSMDSLGIRSTLVCPHLSIGPDFRAGNDLTLQTVTRFPDRFMGAIGINPNYPDLVLPEIRRFADEPGMRAIKLHPSLHNYPAGGDAYREVYEEAARRNLPVTTHTWRGDKNCAPSIYAEVALEYPETVFLLIHSGGDMNGIQEAIESARKSDNVYLDTSGSTTFHMVERLYRGLGSKRILFGSDSPFIDPAAQLGKIIYAPIPDEAKLDIMGLNGMKLLGI